MGVVIRVGERVATRCQCVTLAIQQRQLRLAQIPPRFEQSSFASFDLPGRGRSIQAAHRAAIAYVREWLPGVRDNGLLLHGPVGTGKTHLGVSIVRELVAGKGARGLFVDFRDLLKKVQASYSDATTSEAKIFGPVFEADVVVLDELGAMRTTDWVADCIERILGERYNSGKSTIITTNFAMRGPGAIHAVDGGPESYARAAQSAVRESTLGDRIGARMYSRLQQMCKTIQVDGTDYRVTEARKLAL